LKNVGAHAMLMPESKCLRVQASIPETWVR